MLSFLLPGLFTPQIHPPPYRPNVRFIQSPSNRILNISTYACNGLYNVAVNSEFIIGLILISDNRNCVLPFVHCTHNTHIPHACVRGKLSINDMDKPIPITEEENLSFRFFKPLDPESNVYIAQLRK